MKGWIHNMDMNIQSVGVTPQNFQTDKPAGVPAGQAEPKPAGDEVSISGEKPPQPGTQKKWTFLLYGAGDNNLSSYIENNVKDMEKVGSDDHTHLVAQLDKSSGDCKRYYVTKNDQPGIHSPVLENMGPHVNMADPKTLTDFIVWGAKTYPGEFIGLSIGDHGGGTAGAVADDRDGGYGMMSPQTLKKAITDAENILGRKLDMIGFDCCLMANTEVAYELKDTANYLVASEETEGGYGWPYTKILTEEALKALQEALKTRINVSPKEFATKVTSEASTVQGDLPTMSTIDLGKMGDVAQKLDGFAQAILDTDTPMKSLKTIAGQTESFQEFKDIYDFSKKVSEDQTIKDEKLKTAAKDVIASLDQAILASEHSERYPDAHGLQIEIPSWGGLSSGYKDLQFAKDTKWDEAMNKMTAKTPGEVEEGPVTPGPGGPGWPGGFDFDGFYEM
jgi:hypothetical protein